MGPSGFSRRPCLFPEKFQEYPSPRLSGGLRGCLSPGGNYYWPILLMRKLSLSPDTQPGNKNVGVHGPTLGLSTFLTLTHAYLRSRIPHTPSCTPTSQARPSHTRAQAGRHLQHTLGHTFQTSEYTLASATPPTDTPPPWLRDRPLSHTSETHSALLRHVGQAQPLHPEIIKTEQTPSKSEKQMPSKTCFESSESPVVSLRPMLRRLWLPFVPLLIMKQALCPLLWAWPSQPGVGGVARVRDARNPGCSERKSRSIQSNTRRT